MLLYITQGFAQHKHPVAYNSCIALTAAVVCSPSQPVQAGAATEEAAYWVDLWLTLEVLLSLCLRLLPELCFAMQFLAL